MNNQHQKVNMKTKSIRFFAPEENQEQKAEKRVAKKLSGKVSAAGRLGFTANIIEELGLDPEGKFQLGSDGKRKIKSLYLVPAQDGSFSFARVGRGLSLEVPVILKKGGIDFETNPYIYTITPFHYEGVTAYELEVEPEVKVPYTGKPRGRKPKAVTE